MGYGLNQYGELIYGQEPNEVAVSDLTPDLMAYLPAYYANSQVMKVLQGAISPEIGLLKWGIKDVLQQFFITTTTWGLDLWESELGIETDPLKNYLNRREIIMAKLRGYGTTTKAMIESVALAYSGGEVEVIEYPGEYRFVVKFVGTRGIPPNMAGLTSTIEAIKPAHLGYSFAYTYLAWNQAKNLTWADANTKSWTALRNMQI